MNVWVKDRSACGCVFVGVGVGGRGGEGRQGCHRRFHQPVAQWGGEVCVCGRGEGLTVGLMGRNTDTAIGQPGCYFNVQHDIRQSGMPLHKGSRDKGRKKNTTDSLSVISFDFSGPLTLG